MEVGCIQRCIATKRFIRMHAGESLVKEYKRHMHIDIVHENRQIYVWGGGGGGGEERGLATDVSW